MRRSLAPAWAVVVASASVLLSAGPAAAAPSIAISSPVPGQAVGVKNPVIVAEVNSVGGGKLVGQVNLRLDWVEGDHDQLASQRANGQGSQSVRFPLTLAYNGSYLATIEAADDGPVGGQGSAQRQFFVAAPPAVPSGVRAAVAPGGKVAVSWNRNPEPDMVGYRVERSAGSGPVTAIGTTKETSFTDPGPAGSGGYQVVALRRGARPGEEVASAPSPLAMLGAGAKGGAPAPLGKADLSKFSALLADARAKAGTAGGAQPGEDGAFDPNLPYARSAADDEELGTGEGRGLGGRALPFVAGGLLALDAFLLLRWIRGQVRRTMVS